MVEATKRRVGSKATVLAQDLSDPLPFRNETFDMIISSLTLHYVEEWGQTFQEFYRVMKLGGYLFFSVNHPFMDFNLFKREDYFARELFPEQLRQYDYLMKNPHFLLVQSRKPM